jgi:hypothetical protein
MKIKLLLETALDVVLISLLIYSAFLWLFNPAHQIPELLKQGLGIVAMTWICYHSFMRDNSNDDWVGGF